MEKICSKCKIPKELNDFPKNKNHKDGYHSVCKQCKKEYNNLNKEEIKNYRKNNQEYYQEYYIENKNVIINRQKENKEKINQRIRNRYENNINFRLRQNIRNRFYHAIKKGIKSKSVLNILGCSIEDFHNYIESKFKPEMSWDNQGKVWEIDHIKPCSKFNLENEEDQKQCFNFSNLQPLFKTTKIAKSFGYNEIGNRNKSTQYVDF